MLKKSIAYLVIIGIFIFLGINIIRVWMYIPNVNLRLGLEDIALLILIGGMVYLSNIICWHMLTKSLDMRINLLKNLRIWMLSNFSRLLPGGIWQYPSRVYLLSGEKVTKTKAATTVFL